MKIANYLIKKSQWGEEFKANQYVIFTQDCRFRMEMLDAMGEIKENMIGKVKSVEDDFMTVEIGKQEYSIPYLDAYRVLEPFRAQVVSPEQEGRETEEGKGAQVPQQQPQEGREEPVAEEEEEEGAQRQPVSARPEIAPERKKTEVPKPVPIKQMKPLEKALQVETVLKNMMKRRGIEDPRKGLGRGTSVMVDIGGTKSSGVIQSVVGNDYAIKLDTGRTVMVPIEAISKTAPRQEMPPEQKPVVSVPAPVAGEDGDIPVGSEVWVIQRKTVESPGRLMRGFVRSIEGGNYSVSTEIAGRIVANRNQLRLISKPKKEITDLPYPPIKHSKSGLSPLIGDETLRMGNEVYVKTGNVYIFSQVVEQKGDKVTVMLITDGSTGTFDKASVYHIEIPEQLREEMVERYRKWKGAEVLGTIVMAQDEERYWEGCGCGGDAYPAYYDANELILKCGECGQEFAADESAPDQPQLKKESEPSKETTQWEQRWMKRSNLEEKVAEDVPNIMRWYNHGAGISTIIKRLIEEYGYAEDDARDLVNEIIYDEPVKTKEEEKSKESEDWERRWLKRSGLI
jgi:preprotein translocase subunit YajC